MTEGKWREYAESGRFMGIVENHKDQPCLHLSVRGENPRVGSRNIQIAPAILDKAIMEKVKSLKHGQAVKVRIRAGEYASQGMTVLDVEPEAD